MTSITRVLKPENWTLRLRPGLGSGKLVAGRATPEFVWLLVLAGVLVALGLVMTFSASFVESTRETGRAFYLVSRQAMWAGAGLVLAGIVAVVDYHTWRRISGLLLAATLGLMVLVLFLAEPVNGAKRWFDLGPFQLQPAEIVKVTLPIWCAYILSRRWGELRRGNIWALLSPAGPVIVIAAVLVALAPDLESALLVAAIGLTTLFVAGLPLRILVAGAIPLGLVAWWDISRTPYRMGRFAAWMDPTAFADTFGYQTTQGFIALGSGGWLGVGLGEGRGKWLYIPNAHTDFIYAIIGEEIGLVGALLVLLAFGGLAVLGVRISQRAPDQFGSLLAAALTASLALQAAINISSVVGLLPVTGVTLPLVSFGGSSLVVSMVSVGLLLSIARSARSPVREGA